eukprot:6976121-Pyramimonas_sp.AAC.1
MRCEHPDCDILASSLDDHRLLPIVHAGFRGSPPPPGCSGQYVPCQLGYFFGETLFTGNHALIVGHGPRLAVE